jgi:hypothetical protein
LHVGLVTIRSIPPHWASQLCLDNTVWFLICPHLRNDSRHWL